MTAAPSHPSSESFTADLARRIELYLDDAPMYGQHSDKAGGSCWELLREAMEELRTPALPSGQAVHICSSQYKMRELPDPNCSACAGEPHRLDPFPFRGTDPALFNAALIIDPSIQLSTTPESMREEALRKAKEIAGACGGAQAGTDPFVQAMAIEDAGWPASPSAALPAGEAIERRWTEDELALAFFDFSACTQARCTFRRMGGCHCVIDAYRAVNMVKNVLPRSFPLASSVSSTHLSPGEG